MKDYTNFCMEYEDFREAIKNKIPLEVLTMREYWTQIGDHVFDWSDEKLLECFKRCNYRLKPKYKIAELTKGCLADKPKSIPHGYLW